MNHIFNQPQFGEFWFDYPELYSEMVKRFSSGSKFVEVGSWKGMSSAYMAVEIANSEKNIDFYCVDTWNGSVEHELYGMDTSSLYETFIQNMNPVKDYFKAIRSESLEAAKQFEDNSLDFVFIDASHEYKDVKDDIISWLPKVKYGGVIAGHDYAKLDGTDPDFPGVKLAVHELLTNIKPKGSCWMYEKEEVSISRKAPKVFIVTPSKRPFNLEFISKTIPSECEWVVVLDGSVKNNYSVENATVIKTGETGYWGNPNRNAGLEYIKNNLNPIDTDWIYILDDDNIIHPEWWSNIQKNLKSKDVILTWGQTWFNGEPRTAPTNNPKIAEIDTSQYMVKWKVAKDLRFEWIYEADGIYAEETAKKGSVKMLDQYLGYYNFLRSHRMGPGIGTNICMISMFKNEAKGIRRMLESVWKHIDFYIFQDNGSTDGTPEIVKDFFKDKNIPGFIYNCDEGWVGFGWNRDHLLQTCLKSDHGCDWILKMDCDEYLEVDDDFDWAPLYDKSIQSFHITAVNPGCVYYRAWMWNAKLPWHFKHDVAHECIVCDLPGVGENFQRYDLPKSIRQVGTNDGESYTVPTKYVSDSLKLEEQHIREGTLLTDPYHFWYVAKSYHDATGCNVLPLKEKHQREYARRAIFYFKEYLNHMINYDEVGHTGQIWEMGYFTFYSIAELYRFLGDYESAIDYNIRAEPFCSVRNEHIVGLAECYKELGDFHSMKIQTERLIDPNRKLPFPDFYFLVNTNFYIDSGEYGKFLHQFALENLGES